MKLFVEIFLTTLVLFVLGLILLTKQSNYRKPFEYKYYARCPELNYETNSLIRKYPISFEFVGGYDEEIEAVVELPKNKCFFKLISKKVVDKS